MYILVRKINNVKLNMQRDYSNISCCQIFTLTTCNILIVACFQPVTKEYRNKNEFTVGYDLDGQGKDCVS